MVVIKVMKLKNKIMVSNMMLLKVWLIEIITCMLLLFLSNLTLQARV